MKIAFLNITYGKVRRGGETFTGELAEKLGSMGNEVRVFGGFGEFWASGFKADVVIPVNGRLQALLVKLWCLVNNKKMVISGQSGLGIDDKINLWCRPDAFVTLTIFQADWAKKYGLGVRVETIPNGVDLKKFNSEVKPIPIDLLKPVILNVSALTKEKRLDLTIEAVSKTKGSLLLVGQGPCEEELKELGEKLLPGRFKIMSLPHDQMPQVYSCADVLVFSTVPWESFGIVMLEGMATNLPVVASDDPIRKEIIGNAGYTVDVTNVKEFAKKIEEALGKNWGNIPRFQAEKFSWDKIAQQYDQLFRHLTGI